MTISLGFYCAGRNYVFAALSMRKAAKAGAGKKQRKAVVRENLIIGKYGKA